MNNSQDWTEIIKPQKGIFDLRLYEIWRYRDLLMILVRRDFVSIYKQTILGPLWYFIQPLLTTLMMYVVFTKIAGISTDGLQPILFYMIGNIAWAYFASCLTKTSNTFIANAGVFGKVYFPRLVVPLSNTISSLFAFFTQLILFFALVIYYVWQGFEINMNIGLLVIPYFIILMALLGLGMGIIISSLTTKYRDLAFLLTFGVQLFMYITPVIYPISSIGRNLQKIIMLNPMTSIIEGFRYAFLGTGMFEFSQILYSTIFTIFVLFIGILIFNKVEQNFMDTV
ncbi:MAG: ABC transporter permease [Bacteroidia bacterium]|nr:ABC transporter permease [Bacteroidia bacterium]